MHWRAFAFCLRWPCYFMPWRKTVCVIVTLPGFLRGLSNCWFKVDCRSNYKLILTFLFHHHSIATQGNQDLTILEYEQRMAPQRSRVSVVPEVALKVGSPGHVVGLSSLTQAQVAHSAISNKCRGLEIRLGGAGLVHTWHGWGWYWKEVWGFAQN